jgi:hypothetical protein
MTKSSVDEMFDGGNQASSSSVPGGRGSERLDSSTAALASPPNSAYTSHTGNKK